MRVFVRHASILGQVPRQEASKPQSIIVGAFTHHELQWKHAKLYFWYPQFELKYNCDIQELASPVTVTVLVHYHLELLSQPVRPVRTSVYGSNHFP